MWSPMARKKVFDYDLDDTASFEELERDIFGEGDLGKKRNSGDNSRPVSRK